MISEDELASLSRAALGAAPGSSADQALQAAFGPKPETMEFAVLPLYDHHGRRRSKESIERDGHRVGQIHISAVNPLEFECRPNRRATLVTTNAAHAKPYFGDLFDPEIVL